MYVEEPSGPRNAEDAIFRGIRGGIAQLVEHRTHKPVVGGSIPPPATRKSARKLAVFLLTKALIPRTVPTRDRAVWQLAWLITKRSLVQIQLPQP